MNEETTKFYYRVYGLNVESEIYIPEFSIIENIDNITIDTVVRYKEVSQYIKDDIKIGKTSNFTYKDMWFDVKDLAIYHIYNGDKVDIELYENADKKLVTMYIVGTVLGLVLLQKERVAIHGGAISINGKGCVFTGDKGVGKSTLTTALRQRGYKFIADDVASINLKESTKIYPGFGYQKICEDTMEKLGYDPLEFTSFFSGTCTKYIVPALDSFIDKEVDFNALFEIVEDDVDDILIEEVDGYEKLKKITNNIFNVFALNVSGGISNSIFKQCIDIAKNIKCYRIVRPANKFTIDEQIASIESIII